MHNGQYWAFKKFTFGTFKYKLNIDLILTSILLQMKSSIVKQISVMRVETVERVQQTSNVIAEATSVVAEVTVEAQVCLSTLISRFITYFRNAIMLIL